MRLRATSAALAAAASIVLAGSALGAGPATGQWAPIGPPVPTLFDPAQFDSVQGSRLGPDGRLYIYGSFENAGGDPTADNLAAYDFTTNSVVGVGSDGAGDGAISGTVDDIAWVGSTLYVGGSFDDAAGIAGADGLAAWNGSSWSARPGTRGTVLSLASRDGLLYVAGSFADMGWLAAADNLAIWDGRTWSTLGDSAFGGVVDQVLPLADGRVFAVGRFDDAGGNDAADRAAWWDPASESWESVAGTGSDFFNGNVYAVAVSGSRVVLGGVFFDAAGLSAADEIVEWTGSAWKAYDGPSRNGAITSGVVAGIRLYGSNVIVAGSFPSVAGLANSAGVAVFNGSRWLALASSQATTVPDISVVGRTLYLSTADVSLANGAIGIEAYGLPAAPSAPRSLHAAGGIRKASLSWSAPSTVNGSTLRDYVVQYRTKGSTTWKTFVDGVRTTRTATVTGLTKGVTYQFRVLAKNDWGTGPASGIVQATAK
jgi:hypothetical protein